MKLKIRLDPRPMTDAQRLLREYIERFEAGGAVDPSDLLEQAEGPGRAELATLIEGYLEHVAPGQEWDAEAFEGSVAERAVARVAESWSAASGELPHELVALRNKKEIKRRDLVASLAERLVVGGSEEKVGLYYHQLERGLLASSGVSAKVFDALASILGTTPDALRTAGRSIAPPAGGTAPATYARMASPAQEYDTAMEDSLAGASPGRATEADWDDVDRLFLGGDS